MHPLPSPERVVLLAEAGTGPLGSVWLGERRRGAWAEPVAVKVVERRYPRDVEVSLALRERGRALVASGVGAWVVPTVDLARVGHRLAFVRPWVDGLDLLEWVEILRERDLHLPARVACEVLAGAAGALAAALAAVPPGDAHPIGEEHRDFKPTNVLIRRDGEVRVVDFGAGFSSIAGRSARAGALQKGLVRYLSPARREGKRGGAPADVYALGILGVELLRGRWLRRLHLHNPAHDRHLAEVVARVPRLDTRTKQDELALRNLLLRMVAWDPEGRPTAAEAHQTLRALADRAPGPSLASFSAAHLVPHVWRPVVDPEAPGPGEAEILSDDAAPDALPAPPDLPEAPGPTGPRWEETPDGWRIVDDATDEETTDLTPLPLDLRVDVHPEPVVEAPPPRPPPAATPFPWAIAAGALVVGALVGAGMLAGLAALAWWLRP